MDVKIRGVKEHNRIYRKIQDRLTGRIDGDPLRQAVAYGLTRVVKPTKERLTSGNPLFVRSGRLRASILVDTKRLGKKVHGEVGTDVFYGAIHELRGVGKKKKKRPFLHPSFVEKKDLIRRDIARAIKGIMHGK